MGPSTRELNSRGKGDGRCAPVTLERLYRRHFARVHAICRAQLRDRQLALDAAEEVFVRLLRRPPSLRDGALDSWLAMVARHVAIRIDRREKQRKARERQVARLHREAVRTARNGDDSGALAYLRQLPAASRQAVYLRVVEGRPLRQVGLALGISPGAAQHRITRALARLREMMENDGRASS